MNRHGAAVRGATRKTRKTVQIDLICDIQVKAKVDQVVMIWANVKGRKLVEDLWPDVEWATDEIFSRMHSPDWLFTHIRVTKLPPHLEENTPLTFASQLDAGFCPASTKTISISGPPSTPRLTVQVLAALQATFVGNAQHRRGRYQSERLPPGDDRADLRRNRPRKTGSAEEPVSKPTLEDAGIDKRRHL
jgi:hypothetical protein